MFQMWILGTLGLDIFWRIKAGVAYVRGEYIVQGTVQQRKPERIGKRR